MDARFCGACGNEVSSLSQLPTELPSPPPARSRTSSSSVVGRIESSSGGDFQPGQVLDRRYRIIGLLGRGGMGEVYRADDLELDAPVALKFLPVALTDRADLLERLRGEVRNARQVSHPNVCRVYDVGEVDGRTYMTMEYVDGEDLGTLLRRIGRLPRAKADQVARQMCAGLAAAHDRGVIHRDLKPSNVMIDGDGRVRITDFGLAVRGEERAGEISGTPAYMAPEQFDGRPATVQSDLYSLGLILYEIHTGKRALEADTWDQWRTKHRSATPSSPSAIEADVDEAVSRAILRCLEKDPARRPTSALQLAASLPGGDPLAAALAAGETPSPQMVATAGGEGALAPARAWALLGGTLLLLAGVVALAPWASDFGLAPLTHSAPVLAERAREIRRQLGYLDTPRDTWSQMIRDYPRLKYAADHEPSTGRRREFHDRGVPWLYQLRTSPRWLVPANDAPDLSSDDPALNVTGMTNTTIDFDGRLRRFLAVPPQQDAAPATERKTVDWTPLFTAAALDTADFARVATPTWNPLVPFDERAEWVRRNPPGRLDSLTVSAAAWRGRPVWFAVSGPWTPADRDVPTRVVLTQAIAQWGLGLVALALVVGGGLIARRHHRAGRSDTRGALRLMIAVTLILNGLWIFGGHHVADGGAELQMCVTILAEALATGAIIGLLYLSVEPFVRRHTPKLLIGWARLLEGRWRDPRVGHDVLVGTVLGIAIVFLLWLTNAIPSWIPLAHETTVPMDSWWFAGGGHVVGAFLNEAMASFRVGFLVFVAYFVLRMLLRRAGIAAAVLVAVATVLSLGGENWVLEVPFAFCVAAILAIAIVRFGLLTTLWTVFVFHVLASIPLVTDSSSAAFWPGVVPLVVVAVFALVAFRLSLGQRPVFQFSLEE